MPGAMFAARWTVDAVECWGVRCEVGEMRSWDAQGTQVGETKCHKLGLELFAHDNHTHTPRLSPRPSLSLLYLWRCWHLAFLNILAYRWGGWWANTAGHRDGAAPHESGDSLKTVCWWQVVDDKIHNYASCFCPIAVFQKYTIDEYTISLYLFTLVEVITKFIILTVLKLDKLIIEIFELSR